MLSENQRGGTLKSNLPAKSATTVVSIRAWVVYGNRRWKELTVKDTGGSHHDRRNDGRAHSGQLLAVATSGPAASVECIRLPWNVSVTLITSRPSLSHLFIGDADSVVTDNAP